MRHHPEQSRHGSRQGRAGARRSRGLPRAFTLVEVAAVTLILAILAGSVVWAFSGPINGARATDAIDRVRSFDETARRTSAATGREVSLRIEPGGAILERFERTAADEVFLAASTQLPPGYRIERLLSLERSPAVGGGRSGVPCVAGRTPTYAVQVLGPGIDRWLVFAGLSGQATELTDEREVRSILQAAARTTP